MCDNNGKRKSAFLHHILANFFLVKTGFLYCMLVQLAGRRAKWPCNEGTSMYNSTRYMTHWKYSGVFENINIYHRFSTRVSIYFLLQCYVDRAFK